MINSNRLLLVSALMGAMTFAACGPDARNDSGDNDTGDSDDDSSCVPIAEFETCGGGVDDDCDGFTDCEDTDCLEVELCTGGGNDCGEVETPTAALMLPDGDGPGCGDTSVLGPNSTTACVSYDSSIEFAAFANGATLPSAAGIIGICAVMEHSYFPDMQIEASCPDGTVVALNRFPGARSGGYLGIPNDNDENGPMPGTGWEYCWAPTGGDGTMFSHAGISTLPAGNYIPDDSFDAFVGCPLNGDWSISVEDRYGLDNGFIFSWTVKFDPELFRAECQID